MIDSTLLDEASIIGAWQEFGDPELTAYINALERRLRDLEARGELTDEDFEEGEAGFNALAAALSERFQTDYIAALQATATAIDHASE